MVSDIRADAAEGVAGEIRARGGEARSLACDISDRPVMMAAAEMLASEGVIPSLLWANAGVGAGMPLITASIVDVTGPFTGYAASRQGTAAVAELVTAELAPRGVGVTILYPDLLNTNIWDAARARPERFGGVV